MCGNGAGVHPSVSLPLAVLASSSGVAVKIYTRASTTVLRVRNPRLRELALLPPDCPASGKACPGPLICVSAVRCCLRRCMTGFHMTILRSQEVSRPENRSIVSRLDNETACNCHHPQDVGTAAPWPARSCTRSPDDPRAASRASGTLLLPWTVSQALRGSHSGRLYRTPLSLRVG